MSRRGCASTIILAGFMLALWVLVARLWAQPAVVRPYWPTSLDSLAVGHHRHTHIAVTGTVAYVRREDDGDTHVRLLGSSGWFIVGECIPVIVPSPCAVPLHTGESITIRGISRQDPEHLWYEVHPIESITVNP